MKTIPLTRGYVAVVDDTDYEWLSRWNWHASGSAKRGNIYAVHTTVVAGERTIHRMHRVILGLPPGKYPEVDHADGDTLNNHRGNLRVATRIQNGRNLGLKKHNKSGYPGVHWDKSRNKWMAYIKVNYKRKHLGYYDDFDEAVAARKEAELEYFGDYSGGGRGKIRRSKDAETIATRRKPITNTSGVKGVTQHNGQWVARITRNGKRIYLGVFKTVKEAAEVRKKAEEEMFGGLR